jgi:ferrochelatase
MLTSGGDGVLLVAHGTVQDLADMPAFLARIRHGRPAPDELVRELVRRYEAVGGSPLLALTRAQANELAKVLGLPVLIGMRLWQPAVETALLGAAQLGLTRLCLLPLAPFSVHVYWAAALASQQAVRDEIGERVPNLFCAPAWSSAPEFVEAQAQHIAASAGHVRNRDTGLILTAHSLPSKVIAAGDPYATHVEACARAIADRLGCEYHLAYQSQGADGGEWLGPDLKSVLVRVREAGKRRALIAPFGFLSDHIETLYDLDIEAKAWAAELGLEFTRVPALNTNARFIAALAKVTERAFAAQRRAE